MNASVEHLGVGMATVMRIPKRADQLRFLEGAWGLGYRYFDVAPLYGLGSAETLLGQFSRRVPSDEIIIATKVGLSVSSAANFFGRSRAQVLVRSALTRYPQLRPLARAVASGTAKSPQLDEHVIRRSLAQSLEALQRESVDILLTHELDVENLDESALDCLRDLRSSGKVKAVGASLNAEDGLRPTSLPPEFTHLQAPAFAALVPDSTDDGLIMSYYGIRSSLAQQLAFSRWSASEARALGAVASQGCLLMRDAMRLAVSLLVASRPSSRVIVGTTSLEHLVELKDAALMGQQLTEREILTISSHLHPPRAADGPVERGFA